MTAWRVLHGLDRDPRALAIVFVGVALAVYLQPSPLSPPIVIALLALCLPRWPGRLLLATALIAAAWTSLDIQQRLAERWPLDRSGATVEVRGFIDGLVSYDAIRARFVLVDDDSSRSLRLSWYDAPPGLRAGDCVQARVKLDTPHGSANPGVFDFEAWLWREGIDATGYVRESLGCRAPPRVSIDRWRAAALSRVDASLDESPMRGIVTALTLGVRDGITDDQWAVLRTTGTSHLVAISGLHIGLIAAVVFVLTRWLGLRLYARWPVTLVAAGFAFVAALAYAVTAGFALPTQRALVMVSAGLVALCLMRRVPASRVLALAAVIVVAWSPVSVITPGFWMSFGAVAWLTYTARALGRWRVVGLLKLQAALVLGLAPLTLWFFGEASVIAALVNALLIPAATLFVPLLLFAMAATLIAPGLGAPLLNLLAGLLALGWPALAGIAQWPLASVSLALPGVTAFALALVAMLVVLMPAGLPGRWLAAVLLLPAAIGWQPRLDAIAPGAYRLTMLDVGQGQAIIVRTRTHTLLYDAGPAFRTGFNAGDAFIVPYLRSQGVGVIDRLVISHGDIDHAGGAAAVRAALPVGSRVGADGGSACRTDDRWRWDGVEFGFVYPTQGDRRRATSSNDRSCVLRITGPGGRVLLTGDIEAPAERRLVAREGAALAADALVVAHHGSASSTSNAFLAAVSPDIALISAGFGNRWGFPKPVVLERLARHDVTIGRTDIDGALMLHVFSDGRPIRLERWRRQQPRVWHTP